METKDILLKLRKDNNLSQDEYNKLSCRFINESCKYYLPAEFFNLTRLKKR